MEVGIFEDDLRNLVVVVDFVGDNVGDCVGCGVDFFELIAVENIGVMILGVVLYFVFGWKGILFLFVVCVIGIVLFVIGFFFVNIKDESKDLMKVLNKGYFVIIILNLIVLIFIVKVMFFGKFLNG